MSDPLYTATVNSYYDDGYSIYWGETGANSEDYIESYLDAVAERYYDLLGLQLTVTNPQSFESSLDQCKGTVTLENLDTLCTHMASIHSIEGGVLSAFTSQHPGNDTTTNIYWTCHKIKRVAESGEIEYNRSYSCSTTILMLNRLDKAIEDYGRGSFLCNVQREINSVPTLMHELNHQYGAIDHYHEEDENQQCIHADVCSECSPNGRPETCIMNNSGRNISLDAIICDYCRAEIIAHLESHHQYE